APDVAAQGGGVPGAGGRGGGAGPLGGHDRGSPRRPRSRRWSRGRRNGGAGAEKVVAARRVLCLGEHRRPGRPHGAGSGRRCSAPAGVSTGGAACGVGAGVVEGGGEGPGWEGTAAPLVLLGHGRHGGAVVAGNPAGEGDPQLTVGRVSPVIGRLRSRWWVGPA